MTDKVYKLIVGITTGVESIALAICSFAITNPAIKTGVMAGIPVACNAVIVISKGFVVENK